MLLCSDCCSAQLTHCTVSMEGSKRVQIPERWGAGIVFPRWELPGLTSSEYANNAIGYWIKVVRWKEPMLARITHLMAY